MHNIESILETYLSLGWRIKAMKATSSDSYVLKGYFD